MPRATSDIKWGIIDVQWGIIDVQWGSNDVQQGGNDVKRGSNQAQRGSNEAQWGSNEVQRATKRAGLARSLTETLATDAGDEAFIVVAEVETGEHFPSVASFPKRA